ncbi:MAG: DUF885 domain-containing protein [Myxococcota bacterium]|nr:DUF885 domain-containing protein [Myxococcota bacterium]
MNVKIYTIKGYLVVLLCCIIAFIGCGGTAPDINPQDPERPAPVVKSPRSVTEIADALFATQLSFTPELTYFLQVDQRIHDRLNDNSPTALRRWHQYQDDWLAALNAMDPSTLDPEEWILYGSMVEVIGADIGLRVCRLELWNVNPIAGWQIYMPLIIGQQPVETPLLRKLAMDRWQQFPVFVEREIENLRLGLANGYSAPKRSVSLVIAQLDRTLDLPLDQSPYYLPATKTDDEIFKEQWRDLTEQGLLNALRTYRSFLANEYLKKARSSVALLDLPQGRACYDARIRSSTTQKRTGEHIFELGQKMVAANQQAIIRLGKQLYNRNNFSAIVKKASFRTPDQLGSAEQILSFAKRTADRAFQALPQWFATVPMAPAGVEPWPDYLDDGTLNDRYEPPKSKEGSGIYRISLKNAAKKTKAKLEITTIHELYPGHHLQISAALESKHSHPVAQLLGSEAFVEGWARYAEHLAEEMGLYQTNASKIVRRAWPARGMVVDPGVHLFGWTEAQAISYIMASGVMEQAEAQSLYDRIAMLPGQLTTYDVGASVFFELRDQAKKQLGERFDLREFHDQVLKNGALPLWMLRQHIQQWLDKNK